MLNHNADGISRLMAIFLLFLHVQSSPCYLIHLCLSHKSTPMLVFMSVVTIFAQKET